MRAAGGQRTARPTITSKSGAKQRHGFAIFLRVFKFAVNGCHAAFQRGFELGQGADEGDEGGTRVTRVKFGVAPNFVVRCGLRMVMR